MVELRVEQWCRIPFGEGWVKWAEDLYYVQPALVDCRRTLMRIGLRRRRV